MINNRVFGFGLLLAIGFFNESCKSSSDLSNDVAVDTCNDCPVDLMCTEIFVSHFLKIEDVDGNPIVLDNFEMIYEETGIQVFDKSISDQDLSNWNQGNYLLLSDKYLSFTNKCPATFVFKGFKNGKQVVSESFEFRDDCCHVIKESGKETLVLNN